MIHRPSASRRVDIGFWLFAAAHLLLWTLVPLAIQPNPPLDVVEVVAWGHEWQLGYPKHPPLAAWLAEIARVASGQNGVWAIYLLGQLCGVTGFWAVWRLGRELASPAIALAAVLVLEATGRFTWMTLELNHNLVVFPFFPLTALFVYRALADGRLRWWIAAGASIGLGVLTKYTIGLMGVAVIAFVACNREARRRVMGVGPLLALGVAALIASPHLAWLARNGFPTLSYAVERSESDAGAIGHVLNPIDFLGRQLLMLEFIWVALLVLFERPWRIRALSADERYARQYLFAVALGPGAALVALSVVTGMQLRAAWGMPLWSLLGLLVLFSLATLSETALVRRATAGCALFAAMNLVLALIEGVVGPYATGEGFRTHFPGRALAAHAEEVWRQRFDTPLQLVGGERWLAGNVAFFARNRPSVLTSVGLRTPTLDEAACPWTSVADFKARGGVLVWPIGREESPLPRDLRKHFPDAEALPVLTLPWQTRAHVPAVEIGMAIVVPHARPAPTR